MVRSCHESRLGKLVRARSVGDILALCDGYIEADEPGISVRLVIQPFAVAGFGSPRLSKVTLGDIWILLVTLRECPHKGQYCIEYKKQTAGRGFLTLAWQIEIGLRKPL